jgi:hypothetical protein
VTGFARIPGERTLFLEAGDRGLVLHLGARPSLSLVVKGDVLGSLGPGEKNWPLPPPRPEREWDAIEPGVLDAALRDRGRHSPTGALLAACPVLGPRLAALLVGGSVSFEALRLALRTPEPCLLAPAPLEECHDADLVPPSALSLLPVPVRVAGTALIRASSFEEAARLFLLARLRGSAFATRSRSVLDVSRREAKRLSQLRTHLREDQEGLPETETLRRQGEALLAAPSSLPPGLSEADVPDPYVPGSRLTVVLDPRLSVPANADRLFEKARRAQRARETIRLRLEGVEAALRNAEARVARAHAARDLSELEDAPEGGPGPKALGGGGPLRYLTSRGLVVLVGRSARENHALTFSKAKPDDFWLHARDVPGAHVILEDREGRAGPDDLREAAETAAFFSAARGALGVDVHTARRKHVRAGRGGPGRVLVAHSETLRVVPKDPEGRLRRRVR